MTAVLTGANCINLVAFAGASAWSMYVGVEKKLYERHGTTVAISHCRGSASG